MLLATEPSSQTAAGRVGAALRASIIAGELAPGQKLTEAELAARFGVSHIVIREALRVLEGEGLVTGGTYKSRRVFSLDREEALELMVARAAMESQAAALAARKLTAQGAHELQVAGAKVRDAGRMAFPHWVEMDLEFHRRIWTVAENDRLARQLVLLAIPLLSVPLLGLFHSPEQVGEQIYAHIDQERSGHPAGHQGILDAILNGDAREARACMIRHFLWRPSHLALRREYFDI